MADINGNVKTEDFELFKRDNRIRVNKLLNKCLWICVVTGPAIALGILGGVFNRTSYLACLVLFIGTLAVALGNHLILRKYPYSFAPGVLALIAIGVLLCFMNASHISVRLSWILVPLLSLLFCDAKVYILISVYNYLMMALGTWLEASNYAEIRTDFATPLESFINVLAGCTIEAIVIFAAGYALGKATNNYYRNMMKQHAETMAQKQTMQEQLEILDSMAEIYDFVNLIDFSKSTEMSLREETLHKLDIREGQDHTHMTTGLKSTIVPDMVDDFWTFTDITTVPERLINRKSISGEFISADTGWFRAQYIRVEGDIDKKPDVVIYTIQNIDADKRREEHLIRISRTDELTRMFNRRSYDEDIAEIKKNGIDEDLAVISADVNSLKKINDTLGHSAGDELIKGAASCLLSACIACGNVYRTGGDEFMAIVHTSDCSALVEEIFRKANSWRGKMVKELSLSIGYVSHSEFPDAGIEELETIADKRMYENKNRYYELNEASR